MNGVWVLLIVLYGSSGPDGYGGPVTVEKIRDKETCVRIAEGMDESANKEDRGGVLGIGALPPSFPTAFWCVNTETGEVVGGHA